MKTVLTLLFGVLLFCSNIVLAQPDGRFYGGSISGKIIDSTSGQPIEYANVVLYNSKDASLITGAVTSDDGSFKLKSIKFGKYYIEVVLIGYGKKRIPDVEINRGNLNLDIGTIKITLTAVTTKDVIVKGERAPVTYQIDKKVINVDQLPTAASGTAADVLQNIPSVTVDAEGNVSLRGSGNFTVLIDGKPTILEPQDALQQIQASSIENIEVITNPSAKYNPEGTAGIINIIEKQTKVFGVNGVTNINAGLHEKYGGDVTLELKNSSVTANLGLDFNKRQFPGDEDENRIYYYDNNNSYINSSGSSTREMRNYGIRGGLDFNLGLNDNLNLSGRYGNMHVTNNSFTNYTEYSLLSPANLFYNNRSDGGRTGNFYSLSMNYQHKFNSIGHQLTADVIFNSRNGDEDNVSELLKDQSISSGKKTTESGPSNGLRIKTDYTLPFSSDSKLEAGFAGDFNYSEDDNHYYEYSTIDNAYIVKPEFSYLTKSTDKNYALYSIYSSMIGGFGYQIGLRGEYTYRNIRIPAQNDEFKIDRMDYFPSIHFSYKFPAGYQLMASYSRRIQRPRGFQLEPFVTWMDANTVRKGNPSLLPQFIDSYELGFQTFINKVSFSSEFYYRITNNKIDGIRSAYSQDVVLQSFSNIGKDYSFGNEIMVTSDVFSFWNVNLLGNIYNYRMKGSLFDEEISKNSFNWRMRLNNSFKLWDSFQLQLNGEYNSPTVSSQSRNEGFFTTDLALKKELFNKKLALTLQVRDILGTAKFESTTNSTSFYSYSHFKRESPIVMLNIKYFINNFKESMKRNVESEENNGEEY